LRNTSHEKGGRGVTWREEEAQSEREIVVVPKTVIGVRVDLPDDSLVVGRRVALSPMHEAELTEEKAWH
jgi:hypothetical protein